MSKQSAEYPSALASGMAKILAPLISSGPELSSISSALSQVRVKHLKDPPFALEDGGGSCSKPDWSFPPPNQQNLFKPIRDSLFPLLFQHDMPQTCP